MGAEPKGSTMGTAMGSASVFTCDAVSISTRSVMGSLSGEDASAGMTTTGLMCSDSAEARRKLGGFWGGRRAQLEGVRPVPQQGYRYGWPCVTLEKSFHSSSLPAMLP